MVSRLRRQLADIAKSENSTTNTKAVPSYVTQVICTATVLVIPVVLVVSTWGSFPATPPEFFAQPVPSNVSERLAPVESTPERLIDGGKAGKRENRRDRAARRGAHLPSIGTPFADATDPKP